MDLGEAIYRKITNGRSPHTEVTSFGGAVDWLLARGGNAAAAARLAGVPASTFRGWMRGRQPRSPGAVVRAAIAAQRRARLPRGREARLRAAGTGGITAAGTLKYRNGRSPDQDASRPRIEVGIYMSDAADDLIDAYLAGDSLDGLAEIFHDAISGAQFYEDTFDPDPDNPMSWDLDALDGWG